MKSPAEIPLAESVTFLSKFLPPPPVRVLDVGCGTGRIAARLMTHGYVLQAIDTDPAAVAVAVTQSVPAAVASWPAFSPDDPMAILFVRVLHHVTGLEAALDRCRKVLPPGGLILVEDFAYAEMPESARLWVRTWAQRAARAALLKPDPHPFVVALLQGAFCEPDHEMHSADAIDSALRQLFRVDSSGAAPYFYRYLAESVLDNTAGYQLVNEMLQVEKEALSERRLWPLGRRWVAVKTDK